MSTTITEKEYSSFMVKDEEFIVVPRREFQRLRQLDEYPKLYNQEDKEWVLETIDFWPNWVDAWELVDHLRS